ncbi:uncharacterized protein LOC144574089 isoform X2 [Carex rostrata]
MREARVARANEVDMQAHGRRDERHAVEIEPPKTEITPENYPFFIHQFFSQEKGKFVVSDLVWGKVKSHPWWPGQIIDPSDASTLAIKCHKKDTLLVAYFWDKSFAWCDESQLKPFFSNFSIFEKQVGSDVFTSAVKSALKEVCRRIDNGTMCSCLNDKSLFKVYPKMENAGVRPGFDSYTVDRGKVVNSLNPRGLVGLIRDLALDPDKGTTNKLLLVMSKYHIMAFRRWMEVMLDQQTEPVNVQTESVNLPENIVSHPDVSVPETPGTTTPVVNSSTEQPKRRRGRPRKTVVEPKKVDTTTIETSSDLSSKTNTGPEKVLSGKRRKVDLTQRPSDKGLSGSDNMQNSSYWSEMSLRVQADAILAASAAKRPVIIPTVDKKSDESIPTALLLSFSNKFCKVPSDMEILRMFSQYGPLKGEMEKEVEGSQSRVKLVFKKRVDAEMAFGSLRKQNVFGSYLLSYRLVDLPSEVAESSEQEMVEINGEDHGLLKEITEVPREINPTTLLLCFSNKSGKMPSEMELIRMFSHHGPLKEGGVEKAEEGTTYRFRIAFRKHSSAQMAFSSLRKQNVFGPSLLSYRLVSSPVEVSEKSVQDKVKTPNKGVHSDLEVPALKENLAQLSRPILANRTERPVNIAVGLASTVRCDVVTDISVDPSSIEHDSSPVITISDDRAVDPPSKKQGEVAVVTSVDPSSSVQDADVTGLLNPPSSIQTTELLVGSSCTIEACEMLADPSSTMQGESLGGIPNDTSNTEGKIFGEMSIVSSKVPGEGGGGDEMPINDPLSSGEGNTIEVPIVKLRTEDGEVGGKGKMPSDSSSTRQEDAKILIDPSGTGQNQELSPRKSDNSKAEKQAMALENSRLAQLKPITNGSECTPPRSVISGCSTTPSLQKTSPFWQPVESLELFTHTPQQPHFKKLDGYCDVIRDGMALGLMIAYANLVDSLKNLSFDDDVAVIEEKFTCLETLEENGFNVDLIRTRLNRILQIKNNHAASLLKHAKLEKELAKKESKSMSMLSVIEKIRLDLVKLDEQIKALTEQSRTLVAEKDRLLEQTVGNGQEISRLKNELSSVSSVEGSAREEFARVLAELF